MPYALENPLSAGLAAASGVMAGQQAKKDKEAALKRQAMLDAQAQADTQARLGIERTNQEATQAYRKAQLGNEQSRLGTEQTRLGIERDNATRAQATADATAAANAEKARRDKLREAFMGKGFVYPENWDKMPVEGKNGKIAYLENRRRLAEKNYASASDIKAIDDEMGRVRTNAEAIARRNEPPKPTYRDLHPQPRAGRTVSARETYFQEHGYDPPTYAEAHPKPVKDTTADARGKDQQDALAALGRVPPSDTTGARNKIINHFAAKWGLQPDQARALLQ